MQAAGSMHHVGHANVLAEMPLDEAAHLVDPQGASTGTLACRIFARGIKHLQHEAGERIAGIHLEAPGGMFDGSHSILYAGESHLPGRGLLLQHDHRMTIVSHDRCTKEGI